MSFDFNNKKVYTKDMCMIEGEKFPIVMYKPYIWATINDYSSFYTVDRGKGIEVIKKGERDE